MGAGTGPQATHPEVQEQSSERAEPNRDGFAGKGPLGIVETSE